MTIYTRILQQIGSSMLISLPNEWVKKNTLSKGNTVTIETNIDNTISIYNNYQEEEIKIVFELNDNSENQQKIENSYNHVGSNEKIIKIILR